MQLTSGIDAAGAGGMAADRAPNGSTRSISAAGAKWRQSSPRQCAAYALLAPVSRRPQNLSW